MLAVILCSVLVGSILTILITAFVLYKWFSKLPIIKTHPEKPQYADFQLPQDIWDIIRKGRDEYRKTKESCVCLNLVFLFLFRELKDSRIVRRWVVKKMNAEFEEMLQTTTGRFIDQITARDFNLGNTLPVIHNAVLNDVKTSGENHALEELDIVLELSYPGGFQLAVDVDLVLGRSAYLSVQVKNLSGVAHLRFHRNPYTHWSFAFAQEPSLEVEVESQFEGRLMPQLTSFIVNQIKRTIRKKHILPNYKIRYKPFFTKPEPLVGCKNIRVNGRLLSCGQLYVTVMRCERLAITNNSPDALLYCTLAIDGQPWEEVMNARKKFWLPHEVEIQKKPNVPIGLTFSDNFLVERCEQCVVIDTITPGSPASGTDIKKSDVLVSVDSTKVTTAKQAAKLMKQLPERFTLRIERSSLPRGHSGDNIIEEPKTKPKDLANGEAAFEMNDGEGDFVNITMKRPSCPDDKGGSDTPPPSPKRGLSLPVIPGFPRRRSKGENITPRSSPQMRRRADTGEDLRDATTDSDSVSLPGDRKRAKSDVTEIKSLSSKVETSQHKSNQKKEQDVSSEHTLDLRKTKLVKVSQSPSWNEMFVFAVDEQHRYLNLCVWCKEPKRTDKQGRIVKEEKDIFLGHTSVSLMDISLECLSTLQGDMQQEFKLIPAEAKASASRAPKGGIASRPGYDDNLSHGDIRLEFRHSTNKLSKEERKKIEKLKKEEEHAKNRVKPAVMEPSKEEEEGKHDFQVRHFNSVTYCHLCNKKVWLKSLRGAFQCNNCGMVSHKKCVEKCHIQTVCEGTSYKRRSLVEQEKARSKRRGSKEKNLHVGEKRGNKKHNKTRESPTPPILTPGDGTPPVERRRHNSAPDESKEVAKVQENLLNLDALARTRSSTSLQDMNDNLSPCLSATELDADGKDSSPYSSDSVDSEEEMNFMQYFEQHKSQGLSDEITMTQAKEMGKELFTELLLEERKEKLNDMINKLQNEIDEESENRAELARLERETSDHGARAKVRKNLKKSEERIQALAVLMLQYCSGLQHCMDQQEEESSEVLVPQSSEADVTDDQPQGHMSEVTNTSPDGVTGQGHQTDQLPEGQGHHTGQSTKDQQAAENKQTANPSIDNHISEGNAEPGSSQPSLESANEACG